MSYNNKSIHILRGTGTDDSVKNTVLEKGQPFYDKADHSLKIGQEGDNTSIAYTPRVTSGAVVLDHALTSNLSIYNDGNNIIIKNTGSGHKVQINSPMTEITGNLLPSADGKNIGASNNKFSSIYTSNLLSSSISTSTVAVGEYASISINTGDPDHPNLIIQTGGAEGDITLQSNRHINLNNPSTIHGTLNVTGLSTLYGINNQNRGITGAGAVGGVTTLTTSNTATIGGNIVPASSSAQGTGKAIGTVSNRWNVVNADQINTQSIEGKNSGWTSSPWGISQEGNIYTNGNVTTNKVITPDIYSDDYIYIHNSHADDWNDFTGDDAVIKHGAIHVNNTTGIGTANGGIAFGTIVPKSDQSKAYLSIRPYTKHTSGNVDLGSDTVPFRTIYIKNPLKQDLEWVHITSSTGPTLESYGLWRLWISSGSVGGVDTEVLITCDRYQQSQADIWAGGGVHQYVYINSDRTVRVSAGNYFLRRKTLILPFV